jgi:hypothetical protein
MTNNPASDSPTIAFHLSYGHAVDLGISSLRINFLNVSELQRAAQSFCLLVFDAPVMSRRRSCFQCRQQNGRIVPLPTDILDETCNVQKSSPVPPSAYKLRQARRG